VKENQPITNVTAATAALPRAVRHLVTLSPCHLVTRWPFAAALTSSALLWACHFPLAWGWLGWFALVPLLLLVRAEMKGWKRGLAAWVGGLGFFLPALQWMRVADDMMVFCWLGLALYCSFYFPLGIALLRRIDRRVRLPLTVTVPVVWTALEFLRSRFGGGFSWYLLGQTQHDFLAIIQVVDVAGVGAVTFLVAAVNGLIAEWLSAKAQPLQRLGLRPQLIAVLLAFLLTLTYGAWRLSQNTFAAGPRVALIQGNMPQGVRNDASNPNATGQAAAMKTIKHFKALCDEAAAREPRPDLIVWPETSFPYDWVALDSAFPPDRVTNAGVREDLKLCSQDVRECGRLWKTNVLLGLNSEVIEADDPVRMRRYNSALLVRPDGSAEARYDKMHRVPFGEYVPFVETFPFLQKLAPYNGFAYSIRAGAVATRFDFAAGGKSYRFGVLVCYEDSDADLAREYVRPGAGVAVDFLVNISNDGWFKCTSEHEEHLAVSRFRAVECRRALCRAVNMGISAVIDGNGRVVALPGPTWAASKGIEEGVTAPVPIDGRTSVYAWAGDWLPWLCWLGLVVGCVRPRRAVS
jgi:apolipoprotein N-acyltransferase